MADSDDDMPTLRADTLAALQAFMAERDAAKAAELKEADVVAGGPVALATTEDWQMSQFWYDEATSKMLAQELLLLAQQLRDSGRSTVTVCCISAPSAYKALLAAGIPSYVDARLFEYDGRFAVFGDKFVQYDFNRPMVFPPELKGQADIIILDPPFINKDCLAGFARTIFALRRDNALRTLLCTGTVMLRAARKLLGVRPVRAHVGHANRLSNPFTLYVNYDEQGRLGGIDTEAEQSAETEERAAVGSGSSSGSSVEKST